MDKNLGGGIWRLADPKISITSLASMVIGGAIAARDGATAWGWHGILLLALFCIEVAKNAWGDIYDYDSGTDLQVAAEDRTGFSGGKRVLVDALLTRNQTWLITFVCSLSGLLLGAIIVFFREPTVFWIGALGFAVGWSYHGPPLQLAYRGLGELVVVFCYGPAIAMSTYLIQTHKYSLDVAWLSVCLGLLIAAFLWVNEFPDYKADIGANKRNLVVQLGRQVASRILPLIYLMAFGLLLVIPYTTNLPQGVWLGLAAMVPAMYACYHTWKDPFTFYRTKAVQPAALLSFVLFSAGSAVGILLSP